MTDASEAIARLTRHVSDFPEPGVDFADITPVFADADGLAAVVRGLAEFGVHADLVAGIDARGFLVGSAVALTLGVGVVAVRKAGKLPPPVLAQEYALEYGTAKLEIPADCLDLAGRTVLVLDDVLATGGTIAATVALLRRAGALVTTVGVVTELSALGGRQRLAELPGGGVTVCALSVG